jgi:hypothetical protein
MLSLHTAEHFALTLPSSQAKLYSSDKDSNTVWGAPAGEMREMCVFKNVSTAPGACQHTHALKRKVSSLFILLFSLDS